MFTNKACAVLNNNKSSTYGMFVFSTSVTACPDTSGKLGDIRDRHYLATLSSHLSINNIDAIEIRQTTTNTPQVIHKGIEV